jgi:hypothetical protein
LRQRFASDRDRRLHVLRCRIDVAAKVELNHDRCGAERTQGGQLRHPGNLCELPLQRRGHRSRHRFRAGALPCGSDLNGREIDLWQRSDRQERESGDADERHRSH